MLGKKELSLNKTILFNFLSVFLIQGIVFLTAPIFSRMLGTFNFGVYSAFSAWQSIFIIIFPLSVASTIGIAVNEFPKNEQHAYHSSILTLGIISTAAFSVLILLFWKTAAKLMKMDFAMLIFLLGSTLFTFIVNFANTRYTFELKADKNFVLAIGSTVLTVCLSIALILLFPKEINYWGRIIGSFIGFAITGIIAAAFIYKDGGTILNSNYIKFCMPLSIPVIFHALSNVILNQSDRIMLQNMSNNSIVGIYSLAYNFTTILTAIYSAMNNSWVPFYYRYLGENDEESLQYHADNYITLYSLISVGFLLVFKEVYFVFADRTYWDGITIIPHLVIGFFFMFIYSFAVNYEFYLKKTKSMAMITTTAAILNLVLNYILIKQYSFIGAALATLISYVFEFVAHYVYVLKVSDGKFPFKAAFFIKPLIILATGTVAYYLLDSMVLVRWAFAILVGFYILYSMYRRKAIF